MTHDPVRPEPFDDDIQYGQTREIVLRKTGVTRMLTRRTAEHIIAIGEHVLAAQKPITRNETFRVVARRVCARLPVGLQLHGSRVSIRRQLSNSFTTPYEGTV